MQNWVDPRACGVNQLNLLGCDALQGRSPRMRGKLAALVLTTVLVGSIPAHAG